MYSKTIINQLKLISILLVIVSFMGSAAEFNNYQFLNQQLSLQLDSGLRQMTDLELKKYYGKQKVMPQYAFTNADKNVTVTLTYYQTPASKKDMRKIHQALSALLRKANKTASWKKDKLVSQRDTKIAVYEYQKDGIGQYQYNITYAFPVAGKLAMMNFVCTEKKYIDYWRNSIRTTLKSIIAH
jgi:hypothetical protein